MRFPEPVTTPHGKSALTRLVRSTTVSAKAHITATFASLADWVVITGTPSVAGGLLGGNGGVRYRDQMGTDDYLVTATIGALNNGKVWLITCATEGLDKFYAVEINRGSNNMSIIKANATMPQQSTDLLGWLLGWISNLLGYIFTLDSGSSLVLRYATVSQTVSVSDTVGIRWDRAASTVRIYRNGGQVTSLAVSAAEIPHGRGARYFGVMQGMDNTVGVKFNAVEAQDV